jgi:hypothetical protein
MAHESIYLFIVADLSPNRFQRKTSLPTYIFKDNKNIWGIQIFYEKTIANMKNNYIEEGKIKPPSSEGGQIWKNG